MPSQRCCFYARESLTFGARIEFKQTTVRGTCNLEFTMKSLSKAAVLLLLVTTPMFGDTARIFVLNNHGTTVDVIDPATNKVVQSIPDIPHSHGITFSSDGHHAYITSETVDTLFDVDTVTGKILRQVTLSPGSANLPAITQDGTKIYVCVNGSRDDSGNMMSAKGGFVDVVDVARFEKITTIPMKGGMHDCYTNPDGKFIIATSLGGQFVSLIDPKTDKLLWIMDFDKGVTTSAFELNPDGSTHRIFSGLADFHGFAVIDFATHKEIDRITLPEPNDFRVTGDLVRRNRQPTHGAGISPDKKTLWFVSRTSNGTFVYSLPDLKVVHFIPAPANPAHPHPDDSGDPGWICFSPDGKTAYVPNAAVDSVSAIDMKTYKVVATIPVGRQPDHVETVIIRGK
jgi:YVTN family beta-propeller protein